MADVEPRAVPAALARRRESGVSLLELSVSLAVTSIGVSIVGLLILQNSRIHRSEQLALGAQANARNCLSLITQVVRTAGWDPLQIGFPAVITDADLTDDISTLEILADLNGDGDTLDVGEAVLIRHVDDRIEWRYGSAASLETLAVNVSNDANGDSVPEPLFTVAPAVNPDRITIRVTAVSTDLDPTTGAPARYMLTGEVALRARL